MMPGDADAVKGVQLRQGTLRRVWVFARPYKATIVIFLAAILAAALLALVAPFVFKAIIDTAIPQGDKRQIAILAAIAVGAALADAGLAIVQRWCSARVGEGLIYDLRRTLFAKVQRMPIAFFTRTPTGSITSRLNNDVIGAQTAVTSTLGSVVSNVVVLVTTLAAMIALQWQLTLLTLVVLPIFIIPARRVGRRLQGISREQMAHNAAMNTQMTERFNVSGATLVKLFGSGRREQSGVRTARRRRPRHRCPLGDATGGCSSWRSASSVHSERRRCTGSARSWWSTAASRPARSSPWRHSSPASTSRSPA